MTEPSNESEEQAALAPRHEKILGLGKVLASYLDDLDRSIRVDLNAPEGIEPLRHELRYSLSLGLATDAEVRCAVAVSEISLALEGLVFQDPEQKELPQITLFSGTHILIGEEPVGTDYFAERISQEISCKKDTASNLFFVLTVLVQQDLLVIPGFNNVLRGPLVCLVHETAK